MDDKSDMNARLDAKLLAHHGAVTMTYHMIARELKHMQDQRDATEDPYKAGMFSDRINYLRLKLSAQ